MGRTLPDPIGPSVVSYTFHADAALAPSTLHSSDNFLSGLLLRIDINNTYRHGGDLGSCKERQALFAPVSVRVIKGVCRV